MWLGDITVGDQPVDTSDPSAPAAPVVGPNPFITLAANLSNALIPIKQGVPVNVAIAPQTQEFLMMGGILIGGIFLLSMLKR